MGFSPNVQEALYTSILPDTHSWVLVSIYPGDDPYTYTVTILWGYFTYWKIYRMLLEYVNLFGTKRDFNRCHFLNSWINLVAQVHFIMVSEHWEYTVDFLSLKLCGLNVHSFEIFRINLSLGNLFGIHSGNAFNVRCCIVECFKIGLFSRESQSEFSFSRRKLLCGICPGDFQCGTIDVVMFRIFDF